MDYMANLLGLELDGKPWHKGHQRVYFKNEPFIGLLVEEFEKLIEKKPAKKAGRKTKA